jgi:gliding motility-associated-like protein
MCHHFKLQSSLVLHLFVMVFCSLKLIAQPCTINYPAAVTACNGQATQISPSLNNGYTSFSWVFTGTGSLNNSFVANPQITATAGGILTLTANGSACATSTEVINITISAALNIPNINVSTTQPVCSGNNVTASITNPQANVTYTWTFPGGATAAGTSATRPVSVSVGNGTLTPNISVIGTSTGGCIVTGSTTVSVKQAPDVSLNDYVSLNPFVNCGSGNFNLAATNTSSTAATNATYAINWGDGSPVSNFTTATYASGTDATHSYTTSGFFNLVCTIVGQNGCSATQTYVVFNGTNPAGSITSPGGTVGLCGPANLSFPFNGCGGNSNGTTYAITLNDGSDTIFYSQPPPANFNYIFDTTSCGAVGALTPNVFFVRLRIFNPCGFTTSTIEPIIVNQRPSSNFNALSQGCVNVPLNITNITSPGVDVNNSGVCTSTSWIAWNISPASGWNLNSGTFGTSPPTANPATQGSANLNVTFTTPGIYQIRLIARSNCGADTIIKDICIQTPATSAFTALPVNGCSPLTVNTTNNSTGNANCGALNYSWSVSPFIGWTFTNGTNSTSAQPSFLFTAAGTYTITLTTSNGCGPVTSSQQVTVIEPPTVAIDPISAGCAPSAIDPSAIITNGGGTISATNWTFTGATPASSNIADPTPINYANGGNYSISLSVTNQCGTTTDSENFTVANPPAPPLIISNSPLCVGQTLNLSVTPVTGLNYTWLGPAGFSAIGNTASLPNIQSSNAGTYTITVSAGTCSNTNTTAVAVNAPPIINILPLNPDFCPGQETVTLTASGANNYTWAPATGLNVTNAASVIASPLSTQTYTVIGLQNGNTCPGTASVTLTANTIPVIAITPPGIICNQPVAVQLAATPANGTWSGPTGLLANGQFTPSSVGNFMAYYNYTEPITGCTAVDSVLLNVQNPTAANAGADVTVCQNSTAITLTGSPIGGTWSGSPQISGNQFNTTQSGTFNLTYSAGSGSCAVSDNKVIIVSPHPTVSATANPSSICAMQDTSTLTATGANTYVWSPSATLNTANGAIVRAFPTTTEVYTVIGTNNGCSDTIQVTVNVNELPIAIANDTSFCNTTAVQQLEGIPIGGSWSGTNVTASGLFTPSGNSVLTYSITDVNGCIGSDQANITVTSPTSINAGVDTNICINASSVQLNGIPANGQWSGNSQVSSTGIFNPTTVGQVTLNYTAGTGSCSAQDQRVITVMDLPIVTAAPTLQFCEENTIVNLSGPTPSGGIWSGTGVNTTNSSINVSLLPLGNTTLNYTYTDALSGCSNNVNQGINVNPSPIANAGLNQQVCLNGITVQLTGSPANGIWTGANVTSSGTFTPTTTGPANLTYIYTDVLGCVGNDVVQVDVITPQNTVVGNDTSICLDGNVVQFNGLPSNGTWSGFGGISSTGLLNPLSAGQGYLVYQTGSGTCLTKDSLFLAINALPIVNAGNNLAVCLSANAFPLLGFTPAGGNWTGNSLIGNTFTPSIAGIGNSTLTYSFTSTITGCSNLDSIEVDVQALPIASFTISDTVCSISPIIPLTNPLASETYQWKIEDVNFSTLPTPIFNFANTGDFTVKLITSTPIGCKDSISQIVSVVGAPLANFSTDVNQGCGPLPIVINNQSSGFNVSYSWLNPTQFSTSALPPPIILPAPILNDTTYKIILELSSSCGVNRDTAEILVLASPVAEFGIDYSEGCSPYFPIFQNISYGNPQNYQWDFGNGNTSTDSLPINIPFVTGSADTTFFIRLIVSNTCRADTFFNFVNVLPNTINPFFNTFPAIGCAPLTVNLTNVTGSATNYFWDFGNGSGTNTEDASVTYTDAGNYTIRLIAINSCTVDTFYSNVLVNGQPDLDFSLSENSFCTGQSVTVNNNSIGASVYSWDFGDGFQTLSPNPTHSYITDGNYNIQLIGFTNVTNCPDTISLPITVNPTAQLQVAAQPLEGCMPLNITFTNTSADVSFYSWDFGNGNTSIGSNPSTTYTSDGTYNVNVIGTNFYQCADTTSLTIQVYPKPVSAFAVSDSAVCGVPTTITTTNNSTGAIGFTWLLGDGSSSNQNAPTLQYNIEGNYTLSLIAQNTFACSDTATKPIAVLNQPIAEFSPSPVRGCEPLNVIFNNTSQGFTDFEIDFGDQTNSITNDAAHEFNQQGVYTLTFIVSNGSCADTLILNDAITVYPTPTANFNITPEIAFTSLPSIQLENTSVGGSSFVTDFGNGDFYDSFKTAYQYSNPVAGVYYITLKVTNENGCIDSIIKPLIMKDELLVYIPSSFTPNGDGLNDTFGPYFDGLTSEFNFWVFDRWGEEIFYTNNPFQKWDGNVNNGKAQNDVYVYKYNIKFKNEQVESSVGKVTLYR